jgi:hypothetical protein
MSSTYSTNLALELIGTGDQAGNWGSTTNTNLGTLLEQAVSGYVTQGVTTGTDTTLAMTNGASATARNMFIELTGTGGASTNLIVPTNKKLYFIYNNTAGAVTVKVTGLTGVSVPAAAKMVLVSNGTDIVTATNYMAGATFPSPTLTGTPIAPTASVGTNTTQIATTAFVQTALQLLHPVGSIYTSTSATNPGTSFGFGTWVAFGQGRVMVGAGTGGGATYGAGSTSGNKDSTGLPSHTHGFSGTTGGQSADHSHNYTFRAQTYAVTGSTIQAWEGTSSQTTSGASNDHAHGYSGTTTAAATSVTHTNMQPYIVVYIWNRTA